MVVQPDTLDLSLPEDFDYDTWISIGRQLGKWDRHLSWLIGDWWNAGKRKWGEGPEHAARAGLNYQSCRSAGTIAKKFPLCLRRNKLEWSHHKEVLALPPVQQDEFLAAAEEHDWSVRDLRRAIRDKRRTDKIKQIGEAAALAGKYTVIYADPPWQYEHPISDSRDIEEKYPTVTLEEICELDVPSIAHDDAVLYLWTPPSINEQAFKVVEAWGFSYRTQLV